jgi:hypothetical protein
MPGAICNLRRAERSLPQSHADDARIGAVARSASSRVPGSAPSTAGASPIRGRSGCRSGRAPLALDAAVARADSSAKRAHHSLLQVPHSPLTQNPENRRKPRNRHGKREATSSEDPTGVSRQKARSRSRSTSFNSPGDRTPPTRVALHSPKSVGCGVHSNSGCTSKTRENTRGYLDELGFARAHNTLYLEFAWTTALLP